MDYIDINYTHLRVIIQILYIAILKIRTLLFSHI